MRKKAESTLIALLLVGSVVGAEPISTPDNPAIYPDLPQASVPLVSEAPAIDGKIDDVVWKKAEKLAPFRTNNGSPDDTGPKTDLWLCSSKDTLFLALRCHETDMAGIIGDDKAASWTDDVAEIFIGCGNRSAQAYHQFQVNSFGRYNDEFNRKVLWDVKNMTIAAGKEDAAWTIEIALPFSSLVGADSAASRKGPWRFNVLRSRPMHEGDNDGPGSAKIDKNGNKFHEESSWSPTQGDSSHMPEMFGYLFLEALGHKKANP